ncbi:MAG: alpha/beta hydrolase-fold protein [Candidatus Kapabacteria bacterium]|nr:alpha/beta hydrolase-fold protein [Candidatus Kapabacteria bacterium]
MKKLIAFFMFFGVCSCLIAQKTGDFSFNYTDRGVTSAVYVSVPKNYNPANDYPLLLALHGAGDNGNNMRFIVSTILAKSINAILICPDANQLNGKTTDYLVNLVDTSYNYCLTNYKIDANKKVIMGFSWGGAMAYTLGLQYPEKWVGIFGHAPAIGSFSQTMWDNITKLRLATILGDKDFNYTAVNSLMNSIKTKGGELLYLIKPGVQHVDNAYFNSADIIVDYRACYDFVINAAADVSEPEKVAEKSGNYFIINENTNVLPVHNNVGDILIYDALGRKIGVIEYPYNISGLSFICGNIYFGAARRNSDVYVCRFMYE